MLRQFHLGAALALVLLSAAGCGIKGPLVLPPVATTPAVAPLSPAPLPAASMPTPVASTPATTPAPAEKKP